MVVFLVYELIVPEHEPRPFTLPVADPAYTLDLLEDPCRVPFQEIPRVFLGADEEVLEGDMEIVEKLSFTVDLFENLLGKMGLDVRPVSRGPVPEDILREGTRRLLLST
jgi:hypothetical protein